MNIMINLGLDRSEGTFAPLIPHAWLDISTPHAEVTLALDNVVKYVMGGVPRNSENLRQEAARLTSSLDNPIMGRLI